MPDFEEFIDDKYNRINVDKERVTSWTKTSQNTFSMNEYKLELDNGKSINVRVSTDEEIQEKLKS